MTKADLAEVCRDWQSRLRLQDWDITVSFVRERELDPGSDGDVRFNLPIKTAIIQVVDPIDRDEAKTWCPYDPERILVHELLHLLFAPFTADDDTLEHVAQEQAIHAISQALVTLGRD